MPPSRRSVTIVSALQDPLWLGALPAFRDLRSWSRWLVFLKAAYGLPLTADEHAIFTHHTGRASYAPPPGGWREAVAVVGRQSGKTRIAAALATFEAVTTRPEPDRTELYALMVAQDHRAAMRTLFRYAVAPFDLVALLRPSVVSQSADRLVLESGVTLAAYPCRPAAVRGLRARVVIVDELAFFRNAEGNPVDQEMLRACRPTLATTGGKLIILSSPSGASGALWDLHKSHWGKDDAPTLIWQGSAPEMNPTLPADYLARMEQDDPEAYRAEVLGEFRQGLSMLFDPDALEACVDRHVRERPRQPSARYKGFVDAAGGSGKDRFTLGIAHAEGEAAVLDLVRAWTPPFDPSRVIAECAEVLRSYGLATVHGDRYAEGFVLEAFRTHGIRYESPTAPDRGSGGPGYLDRSQLYLELLPLVNSGRARLLDLPDVLRELRSLERRRGAVRDRVDHRSGGHDDRANACAGSLVQAAGRSVMPMAGRPGFVAIGTPANGSSGTLPPGVALGVPGSPRQGDIGWRGASLGGQRAPAAGVGGQAAHVRRRYS
jgi:hypothetical protein